MDGGARPVFRPDGLFLEKIMSQINPFNYEHDVGRLYVIIHKALNLLSDTWTQSPRFDHQPTDEELEAECEYAFRADTAAVDLLSLADEIRDLLVGTCVGSVEDRKWYYSDREVIEMNGWVLECESPLEVSHPDGSSARGSAAEIVICHLRENRNV